MKYMEFDGEMLRVLAVPMMSEIFQERVKMVSAGNYKQDRSVTVVGTLRGRSVSQPSG